ncbi:UNVERIFIED_CONTAM: hypothetical protein Sradi_0395300 [Sesamum radiatum]|uniref:Uncharacterized protein n=1 Tax=Sesamum radiatum TaxID=300843 RepID=A0AAW2W6I3_SESRA
MGKRWALSAAALMALVVAVSCYDEEGGRWREAKRAERGGGKGRTGSCCRIQSMW